MNISMQSDDFLKLWCFSFRGKKQNIPRMEYSLIIDKSRHTESAFEQFDVMRKNKEQCDFAIRVGSEEMAVHRTVLSATSKYFKAMLSHDTSENRTGTVEIQECDVTSVKKCIDFIYTGRASVSLEKCGDLMHVAHLLQLDQLCEVISDFLVENLNPKSFYSAKNLAYKYGCKRLEDCCDQFALENMGAISKEDEFERLTKDYMIFLITSEKTYFSETAKCKLMIYWIKCDVENRQSFLLGMLERLHVPNIHLWYRRYLIDNEALIYKSNGCLRLFLLSLMDSAKAKPVDFALQDTVHAPVKRNIVVFDKTSKRLKAFDTANQAWSDIHEMDPLMHVKSFSAVCLAGKIYVLLHDRSVFSLEYKKNDAAWRKEGELCFDHGLHPTAIVMNEHIYVVGGFSMMYSSSVERYDPSTNLWSILQDRQLVCSNSSLVVMSGRYICAIGGYHREKSDLKTFEQFEPQTSTWKFLEPMNKARQAPGITEFNNRVFVMGGSDSSSDQLSDMEYYDGTEKVWSTLASMLCPRTFFKAIVVDGAIYAVGGSKTLVKDIEMYDIENDVWTSYGTLGDMTLEPLAAFAI